MTAYYNEFDKYAAEWLLNLIDAGHIAAGVVDTRSILDVHPDDLRGFTQCHFFAGIGVWSHALRRAGWPDDRPVWTGSCPCQPFSAAGNGSGFADERHLWPAWHHLIKHSKPEAVPVFGEQVASKDAEPWIDLVQDDMEAMGYAFGAIPFPAAGVGAAHIRDRLYFVAHADQQSRRQERSHDGGRHQGSDARARAGLGGGIVSGVLGNAGNARLAQRIGQSGLSECESGADAGQATERAGVHAGRLADSNGWHAGTERQQRSGEQRQQPQDGLACRLDHPQCHGRGAGRDDDRGNVRVIAHTAGRDDGPGPTNGLWAAADWILCRDGKWRPVEPGTFPLAHGASARVGRLRAYGNAICAPAAQAFIEAFLDVRAAACG